jgi:predicted CXXCH cytochrome family protein
VTLLVRTMLGAVLLLALIGRVTRADEPASFVGSGACAGCHVAENQAWTSSHHAAAMRPATSATVLGDFSNAAAGQGGSATTFFRAGENYMVRTAGPDGAQREFPIAYTFGVYPLQQYLIALPGGRYQALGIAWDSRPQDQGGQRWYSLHPGQEPKPGDALHWTGRDQTWNYQCAACHSTELRKNFDLATNTYSTTFSDVNVGCEACHGPGSRHLAWAKAGGSDKSLLPELRKGLVAWLHDSDRGAWKMNAHTGIAQRTAPPESSAVLDACGGCHARRAVISDTGSAAIPLLDVINPALLRPGLYHADGQIEGEVFELGSFLQSRMFRVGVTCTNCHEPHAGGLRATGNAVCGQCHMPQKFDVEEHHHHQPGSGGAQCASCHMPAKTYMGVDVRHDHSFRVPRPDLTLAIGVPNVCSQCHADRPATWAAQSVAEWYPLGRQTTRHYGQALHAGRTGAPGAEAQLRRLALDPTAPGIVRATALELLAGYGAPASEPVMTDAIADPDPLVRAAAPFALQAPSVGMVDMAAPLLADPVLAVRVAAARALAGIDSRTLTATQRDAFASAIDEAIAAQLVDSDRPEAHLNLGLLYVRLRQPDKAEAQYRAALRLDPGFVPALVNLADLARMRGMDQQGAELLRTALAIEPGSAAIRHSLGLLMVRQRNGAEALTLLRQAMELAPDNIRYAYVYAIAMNSAGDHQAAMAILGRAHQQHPADVDVLGALVAIARDKGDFPAALLYARALAALRPEDPQLRILVQQLELQ